MRRQSTPKIIDTTDDSVLAAWGNEYVILFDHGDPDREYPPIFDGYLRDATMMLTSGTYPGTWWSDGTDYPVKIIID